MGVHCATHCAAAVAQTKTNQKPVAWTDGAKRLFEFIVVEKPTPSICYSTQSKLGSKLRHRGS